MVESISGSSDFYRFMECPGRTEDAVVYSDCESRVGGGQMRTDVGGEEKTEVGEVLECIRVGFIHDI